jgi:hypothetical protein
MRVLKTEDCFYVGGGNASDTNTGSFGDCPAPNSRTSLNSRSPRFARLTDSLVNLAISQ